MLGYSGRAVGKALGMSKSNVYRWAIEEGKIHHQIVGFDVGSSEKAQAIQRIVDEAPDAQNYYTDGGMVYLDVDFIGRHRRNIRDKSDTHVIESVNADVRHYIHIQFV